MVEVFRTNVQELNEAAALKRQLLEHFPSCHVHFDLEDCDKVLRIEGTEICVETIVALLYGSGFTCVVMD